MKTLQCIEDGKLVIRSAKTWKELDAEFYRKQRQNADRTCFILVDHATTPPTVVNWGRAVDLIKHGGHWPAQFIVTRKKDGKAGIFATNNIPDSDGVLRPKLLFQFK